MNFAAMIAQAIEDGHCRRALEGVPYARLLGLEVQYDGEHFSLHMPFDQSLIGTPYPPRLHGGTIGALLEFTGLIELAAAMTRERRRTIPAIGKPIGITIDYMRAGEPREVYARGEVKRLGSRVANMRAEAWQDDPARPIASAQMHFLIVD